MLVAGRPLVNPCIVVEGIVVPEGRDRRQQAAKPHPPSVPGIGAQIGIGSSFDVRACASGIEKVFAPRLGIPYLSVENERELIGEVGADRISRSDWYRDHEIAVEDVHRINTREVVLLLRMESELVNGPLL